MASTAALPPEERLSFQAEVGRLLDIVAHSLYSDRRIFLRELISNAADASDRLRYAALTQPDLIKDDAAFRIVVAVDRKARTIAVIDSGIGMNREDLVENLGTIARSGTSRFVESLSGDARRDVSLIGQFGVGFYAAFMVADRVEVVSRKAGEEAAWRWVSEGKGEFAISPASREIRGTTVTLHLREDAVEYLDSTKLSAVVAQYSDHIPLPIVLKDDKGEVSVNRASALWTRPKNEVSADQHREFYHHVAHAFDDPWLTLHWRAEGKIEYASLLYVPSAQPFDLWHPERRHGVKLYVKRVFITERCDDLLPPWLRFLRGVVDSEDLPLNISREMLQHNPVLSLIRAGVVARVLGELEKKAKDAPEDYAKFWENFGPVLKEGLYEPGAPRDQLLELARFRSSAQASWTGLAGYVERLRPNQEDIFYITGEDARALARSPQLEGFTRRGVEVLLLADPIDEFWIPAVGPYKGKKLRSITRGSVDLSKIPLADGTAAAPPEPVAEIGPLVALMRLALKDEVKDVRASERLAGSAVCLVADEHDLDLHIERLMRQHKQLAETSKRILELNPRHPMIGKLARAVGKDGATERLNDAAFLLLDQARLAAGEPIADPSAFGRRLASVLERAVE
ncbi:MAG TPA: molecular chaperone HtpG [Alphaproteobacteria bacterium]|nr:molecular chaperone HtpG [Alphaproteobacteria bacterium]